MPFNQGTTWEVRIDGNDSNGGGFDPTLGGTDYTQQPNAQYNYVDLVISSIPPPSAPTLSTSTTGGTIPAGTYYFVVTYYDFNSSRETLKSIESSITTTGSTSTITITSPVSVGFMVPQYNVYAGTVSGGPYFSLGGINSIPGNLTRTSPVPTSGTQPPVTPTTTHGLSSATNPFGPDTKGNVVNITGGTGFTVKRYQVLSVSGGVAYVDKVLGTVGSSNGVGKLGGALASPGIVCATTCKGTDIGQIVFVKSDPVVQTVYTMSVYAYNVTNGAPQDNSNNTNLPYPGWWVGYSVNRTITNNDPVRPKFKVGWSNGNMFFMNGGSGVFVRNFDFDGDRANFSLVTGCSATGGSGHAVFDCRFYNCYIGLNSSSTSNVFIGNYYNNCGNNSIQGQGYHYSFAIQGSYNGLSLTGGMAEYGLIDGCTNSGVEVNSGTQNLIRNLTIVNCPNGIFYNSIGAACRLINVLFYNNNRNINLPVNNYLNEFFNCAAGGGTLANINSPFVQLINIASDPFINKAIGDYRLNNGAGAVCRGVGSPTNLDGKPNNIDIGCYQSGAEGSVENVTRYVPVMRKRAI